MEFDSEDLAYEIVYDYLVDGPEYLTVSEVVVENGGGEDDVERTWNAVRDLLAELQDRL